MKYIKTFESINLNSIKTDMLYTITQFGSDEVAVCQLSLIDDEYSYNRSLSWLGWYHDVEDTNRILDMNVGDSIEVGSSSVEIITAIKYDSELPIETSGGLNWGTNPKEEIATPEVIAKYNRKRLQKRFDL